MRAALLLGTLAATGCYEYDRVEWVIDVSQSTATVHLADLRANKAHDADQFSGLLSTFIQGTALEERFAPATVTHKALEPSGEQLDLVATMRFDDPSDLGLERWDARHGWRFCPSEPGMFIVESNAAWRDAAGCVVWKRGARVLRIVERQPGVASSFSLLSAWQDWDAQGRPLPETAPPAAAPAPN